MADVYEAEHVRLGNRVAVKFLRSNGRTDRRGIERFQHEARRVAALSSEHVVKVFDCGELPNGTPYLVMERLHGEDLRSLLAREGKFPVRRAVELAIGACRGLSVVHAAGLVHRDLKPANLFVVRSTVGVEHCKILDFGVAKALVSDATAGGTLLGTVRYMAPEQLEDAASARATADIYAVGAILYECLTGVAPHRGDALQELMFNIVHKDAAPLRGLCDVPAELERVVMKALSRDKAARFARADRMARALAPFGGAGAGSPIVESADEITLDEEDDGTRVAVGSHRRFVRPMVLLAIGFGAGLATIGAWQSRSATEDPVVSKPTPVRLVAARTALPAPATMALNTAVPSATTIESAAPAVSTPKKTDSKRITGPPASKRAPAPIAGPRPSGWVDSQNPYSE
jgi:serine/threonine-protein kinase